MFNKIIRFSVGNKLLIAVAVLGLVFAGIFSMRDIPLDAVPDITNNQVQIVSVSPTLAPQEVEQLITYPLEAAMTNLPDVVEVRSISRYGLSVITVVFEDKVDILSARQYVQEQLNIAKSAIPDGLAEPELMPITTGLGEIYQYVLVVEPEHGHKYDATELRTIQDWIVKRQLNGTPGIIEVSSFGGYLKQYEVAADPLLLKTYNVTMSEVINALRANNRNSGGSYIEKGPYSYYIRMQGRSETIDDIGNILVKSNDASPVRISDVATVRIGSAKRYGAMTMDGKGEVVGGITLMLKGANSSEALANVKARVEQIANGLPDGVSIYPYLDRSKLIGKTIDTVKNNLIEGGVIVILILLLLLGNLRAGLIVASIIPLSMLFAFIMMRLFGISANLMSLGAIDFGIVVDGAVIIVESLLHTLALGYVGKKLTQPEMDTVVCKSTSEIYRSAAFGVLIILIVFVPILTLEGTEGKTFRPMAQTVGFAILGSLLLSVTYVPAVSALFIKKTVKRSSTISDRIMGFLQRLYRPSLMVAMKRPVLTIASGVILFAISIAVFTGLGAEFIPTLEEGDLAMQQTIKPGSSLEESIRTSSKAEKILLDQFPEIDHVVSKIGTAEVPTDPMAIEDADIMIILKDKEHWTSAETREGLIEKMKSALAAIPWAQYEFTQPIQLRFNELMTGAKSDIAIKIFGEDVTVLKSSADEAAQLIEGVPGAADVRVDQTEGLQQLSIRYDHAKLAQYGITVDEVNQIIRAAYAGEVAGVIFEHERKFDLVVRLAPEFREELDLSQLSITTTTGAQIPIDGIAQVDIVEGPMLIRREQARRFINIGVNVRDRDIASLVSEIETILDTNLNLPPGYEIQFGGQFENLRQARARLSLAVPAALLLILVLLYLAFGTIGDALLIFIAVPLSAIGGIFALYLRGMPFSISSGIGFIALFGVSVLNGIVLVSAIKQREKSATGSVLQRIEQACQTRLRPVLMTALVAAFGFLPMAISTTNGAEVQRPLATVVIGGLITSTLLTLFILPTLYYLVNRSKAKTMKTILILIPLTMLSLHGGSQDISTFGDLKAFAVEHNPSLANYQLEIEKQQLEEKTIGQWSRTRIDYQGGDINFVGYDNYFTLSQNLSHLLNKKPQRQLIQSKVALGEAEQMANLDGFTYMLKSIYFERLYWISKRQLWGEIYATYGNLLPKLQTQYAAGEIDGIELSLLQNEILDINQQLKKIDHSQFQSEMALRALSFLPDTIQLSDTTLRQVPLDSAQMARNLARYLALYDLSQEVVINEVTLEEKRAKQPDLDIGYFHQSLQNQWGYQGFTAGVGIPIDRRTLNARVDQLNIQKEIVENSRQNFLKQYNAEIATLENRLNVLDETLGSYSTDFFDRIEELKQTVDLQYQEGSIDFLRYHQIRVKYLDTENRYLDLLHSYNTTAISLMHYVPKS